ncbi:hypothetical protein [Micromonospora sp. NPDC004551]|uniref:hypothetical protein n=1 Tax=Micromonospora sp. NPDC004551 TaxID=3154284 RepID=UPI0033A8C447
MTLDEAAAVLAKAQAYDRRTVGEADIRAWQEALADVALADALAAVTAHYRDSTDWLMPAHVRARVAQAHAARQQAERDAAHDRFAELQAAQPTPTRSFGTVRELLDSLGVELRPGRPEVFHRAEWVRHARPRQHTAEDTPNPHYQGPPPPGGWPIPTEDDAS